MKSINYAFPLFFVLFLSSLSLSLNAQVNVESIGRVQIGPTLPVNSNDLNQVTSLQVFGKGTGGCAPGAKLSFGDFGRREFYGWNVFVGEYSDADTDQLWLHGKKGIYLTYSNATGNPIAYYDVALGNSFKFNCDVYANNIKLTSDERKKENIRQLSGSLDLIRQLNGVSYNLINPLKTTNKITVDSKADLTVDSKKLVSNGPAEKEQRDMAFFEKREKELSENQSRQLGFIAQDLQKVFPELVEEGKDGIMRVDYIGLIPVIVEGLKEQSRIIEEQNRKINELESLVESVSILNPVIEVRSAEQVSDIASTAISGVVIEQCKLYQNAPNPFSVSTEIKYFLSEEVSKANLYIYDMQGKQLKNIPILSRGENTVHIQGAEFTAGMYIYTLIADGKEVDTKRMILTE